jgi:indole-3-acetate monooxygenase
MSGEITAESLLEKVKEIAPLIRKHAEEAERNRRLSRPVVDAMLAAGLYGMFHPKVFGGLELDPVTMFCVVEEVARHDSAAGWNLQLSVGANCSLPWLPDEGAAEIMRSQKTVIVAGSFTPGRQAIPVEGGYRLTGRWPFGSGSHDSHWLVFIPQVMNGDAPLLDSQGQPVQRFMFVPTEKAQIHDNWHTLGMRGTGSNDISLSNVFVPERHTALLAPLEKPGTAYGGPLYRLTLWPAIALLSAPALGIAQAAIDDLIGLASKKTPSFTASPLAKRQVVQRQVAEAEATLGAGRAYLHEVFRENWEVATQGGEITLARKWKMQLAASHAIACAAKAVDLVHAAAGASGIRNEYKFQQYFRDVHTISQHAFASSSRYESVGAVMLGVESDWGFFAF